MHYTEAVERLFSSLEHAGYAGVEPLVSTRMFADTASDTRLSFIAQRDGSGRLRCRYRATGCPHVLAACEYASRAVEQALWPSATELMTVLGVPIEKTDRILLLEDALAELRARLR